MPRAIVDEIHWIIKFQTQVFPTKFFQLYLHYPLSPTIILKGKKSSAETSDISMVYNYPPKFISPSCQPKKYSEEIFPQVLVLAR